MSRSQPYALPGSSIILYSIVDEISWNTPFVKSNRKPQLQKPCNAENETLSGVVAPLISVILDELETYDRKILINQKPAPASMSKYWLLYLLHSMQTLMFFAENNFLEVLLENY